MARLEAATSGQLGSSRSKEANIGAFMKVLCRSMKDSFISHISINRPGKQLILPLLWLSVIGIMRWEKLLVNKL